RYVLGQRVLRLGLEGTHKRCPYSRLGRRGRGSWCYGWRRGRRGRNRSANGLAAIMAELRARHNFRAAVGACDRHGGAAVHAEPGVVGVLSLAIRTLHVVFLSIECRG